MYQKEESLKKAKSIKVIEPTQKFVHLERSKAATTSSSTRKGRKWQLFPIHVQFLQLPRKLS